MEKLQEGREKGQKGKWARGKGKEPTNVF